MRPGEETWLSSTGNNLTKFLNNLLGSNRSEYNDFANEVTQIFPKISDVNTPFKNEAVTLTVKEHGLKKAIDVGNTSSGQKQILVLAAKIVSEKTKTLLMIEEPELNLHASAQRKLLKFFQEHSNATQFFLTTHSTIFTDCNDLTQTYLVIKKEGASKVEKIASSKDLITAKNALGHRNTDLFGDERVVFIEGDSEEVAFRKIAQLHGYDLCRKGIRLVNIQGSGKAVKMEEYLKYLKDSGVLSYVILDGNKEIRNKLQDWQRLGIIKPDHWAIWDLEFEDCFTYDMIAQAINEILEQKKNEFRITAQQLTDNKTEGITIVRYLKRILYEHDLELDKPELAEKLADLIGKDLERPGRVLTAPEREMQKIIGLVE